MKGVAILGSTGSIGRSALARHPVLFSIGVTALIGLVCATISTLFLVPALLRVAGPRA